FGGAWADVMRLALWVRDGEPPERSRRIEWVWRDPATPTVAQQTDAAVKLVQAGILPAEGEVVLEMAGLSED
ncbi:phage capsid protein, partial [Streptomyces sp. A73]|nr:phage capsid protein [Streptomyces sp. A73]